MITSLSSKAPTLKTSGIMINVDLYYDSVSNCEEMASFISGITKGGLQETTDMRYI
jgi:hypothetical protein